MIRGLPYSIDAAMGILMRTPGVAAVYIDSVAADYLDVPYGSVRMRRIF